MPKSTYLYFIADSIRGSGTESYGDIDLLLAEPETGVIEGDGTILEMLTKVLGATHTKTVGVNSYQFTVNCSPSMIIGMDPSHSEYDAEARQEAREPHYALP
jgi:hypothetical protein